LILFYVTGIATANTDNVSLVESFFVDVIGAYNL